MTTMLNNLILDEVSLVDTPANQEALLTLFKRDTSKGEGMTKEVEKEENPLAAEVETLKAENEVLRKALIDNDFVIKADAIEKKEPVETIEVEGEVLVKSDIPAVILKKMEADAEEAKAHAIEKADMELTEKAKEKLAHFDVEVAKGLLTAIKKSDDVERLMAALEAADAAFEAAFAESGEASHEGDLMKAEDKLEELVKSYMAENNLKKSDHVVAYAAVVKTDEGKALANKSYKEGK